ncbi:trypsin-3-like [Drosophila willistoni]|uniref:trypsin-3-like n=1 Tax=Drosophila willistoni TaxID=7260 RepID=UPI001F085C2D|nr:trypsin-3-like [Drosophila willistoni]
MLSVKSLVPVLGLLLVLSGCGFYFAEAIIGGQFARPGQFPYQGSLIVNNNYQCGCSVISKTTILLAAHCVVNTHANWGRVLLGTSDLSVGDASIFYYNKIIIHPNFNQATSDYDIALLRLSSAIQFSDRIRSIRMAPAGDNYLENSTAITSGFGEIDHLKHWQTRLKYAHIQLWGRRYCNSANIPLITDRMICAGDPLGRQGPCTGDSGGPLTLGGLLIAVSSTGFGCGTPYRPSVFTYVPMVRAWIDANINA